MLGRERRTGSSAGLVAGLLAGALLVSACNGPDKADRPGGSPSPSGTSASPTTSVPPAMVDADGFQRLNVLPQPVAQQVVVDNSQPQPSSARAELVRLDRVGDVVRAVLAWDRPTSGTAASADRIKTVRPPTRYQYEIGLRLYDPSTATLSEPLRASDESCLCSQNTLSSTNEGQQSLFWADFPAPASDTVSLLMGEYALPMQDVPITTDAPPLDLPDDLVQWVVNRPPDTPGEGAGPPVVRPVRRTVQTFGGAEDGQVGGNADVSVPSDVLFAFDSASLTKSARRILAKAAPQLVKAAKGKTVQVVGHTDDQGSDSYNRSLSLRRAQAVASALGPALRKAGITVKATGKGESQPLVPNVSKSGKPIEENRRRNRRVSFVFARAKGGAEVDIDVPKPLPGMPVAKKTTASPEVTDAIASVLSAKGTARLDVTRVERDGDDLWVRFDFTAVGATSPWGANSGILDQNPVAYNATMLGVRLVDAGRRTVALPLDAGEGVCVCTENAGSGQLFAKPLSLWAVFPAPSASTTKVTLRVPGVGQVVNLPIS